MAITLTPDQQRVIEEAIGAGLVGSVDEFIKAAVKALPHPEATFDQAAAKLAVAQIRELRKGVTLNRGNMSFREMAHIGHKY